MAMSKRILAPTLMVLVLGALIVQLPGMADERRDALEWFVPIQDIRMMIRDNYVEEVDEESLDQMQSAAIAGMIETLDDPYTVYVPAVAVADFEKSMGGSYVGIGAEVRHMNGWLTIITPMAGSPAIKAGIRAGDQVREIDDDGPNGEMEFKTTDGEDTNDTIDRLMGNPGTEVTVRVHRKDTPEDELEEIQITRNRIRVATIEGVHRKGEEWDFYTDHEKKIAYVRLNQFTGTSFEDLRKTMWGLVDDGLQGLVLDLRFNPGGRMDAAIRISDLFVPDGRIVSMRGRTVKEAAWDAHKRGTLPDFPMVVLVNGQSASASEIVSGALKDNNRAVILGTRTFGKGKVQDVKQLRSGLGQLKITTAYYYLPSGRNLQRLPESAEWGVDPTEGFYIPLTNTEYFALRTVQQELDIIDETVEDTGDWSDPDWIEERMKDPQLAGGLRAIRERLATGEWVATGEVMPKNAEVLAELHVQERRRDLLEDELVKAIEEIDRLTSFTASDEEEGDGEEEIATGPLLPFDHPLKGGTIEVRDADGNLVRTLSIANRDDLVVAFTRAGLKPIEDEVEATDDDG